MHLVRKNRDDYIYAILEWDVVDEDGHTKNEGKYSYIREFWVHKDYDGKTVMRSLFNEWDKRKQNESILWVYWERQGRNKKLSRLFSRQTILRRVRC